MDILSAATSPSFMDVAYQSAEQQALNNEMVKQKVKSLIDEARYRSEMQPYEIDKAKAATNQMNAQAEAMLRDKTDPFKRAQAGSIQLEMLNPLIAGLMSNPKEQEFKQLLDSPDVPDSLKTTLNNMPPELRRQFMENYYKNMPVNKQIAALQKAGMTGQNAITIQEMKGGQALDQIRERGRIASNLAAQKARDAEQKPSKESYQNASVSYQKASYAAELEGDFERARSLQEQASKYDKLAKELAASAAVAGPEAKAASIGTAIREARKATQQGNSPTISPADFDEKWKTLKSGEKLVGPDGKTYTKK